MIATPSRLSPPSLVGHARQELTEIGIHNQFSNFNISKRQVPEGGSSQTVQATTTRTKFQKLGRTQLSQGSTQHARRSTVCTTCSMIRSTVSSCQLPSPTAHKIGHGISEARGPDSFKGSMSGLSIGLACLSSRAVIKAASSRVSCRCEHRRNSGYTAIGVHKWRYP